VSSLCVGESPVDLASAVSCLLRCLPLLHTGNAPAKTAYLRVLPTLLRRCTDTGRCLPECQQLLSYALVHPAISGDELIPLSTWQPQLQDDLPRSFMPAAVAERTSSDQLVVNGPTSAPSDRVSNGVSGVSGDSSAAQPLPIHRDLTAVRSLPVGLLPRDTSSSLLATAPPCRTTAAATTVHLQHSSPPPGLPPRALTPPRLSESLLSFALFNAFALYLSKVKQTSEQAVTDVPVTDIWITF